MERYPEYIECNMSNCPQFNNQYESNNVCRECDDRPNQNQNEGQDSPDDK